MKQLVQNLSKSILFNNIEENEIAEFIESIAEYSKKYPKNTTLFSQGDKVNKLYLVISGKLQIVKYSYTGQKSVIMELKNGDYFAEAIAFSKSKISPVTVEVVSDCEVIGFKPDEILKSDKNSILSKQLLINLLEISFDKSLALNKKIEIISQRTIKDKVLVYLHYECSMKKTNVIKLPFTKQMLANYLEVDRTALFRVMKQLQNEGYIQMKDKEIIVNQDMI